MDDGPKVKSWEEMRTWQVGLLERATGAGLDTWNARVGAQGLTTERELRQWLDGQGVRGYAQMLLVHETFGYPTFLRMTSDELIDGQYEDRPALRPVLDAILLRLADLPDVTIQVRKTYVSLVGPRRTFAIVRPTTRKRVDLGLRLEEAGDRLLPAKSLGNDAIRTRIALESPDDVDDEVGDWLRHAYEANL